MIESISSMYSIWKNYEPDNAKTMRAKKVQLISDEQPGKKALAKCIGSNGESYSITLEDCTCADFLNHKQQKPCKHMIALAMKLGYLNEDGLTYEQESLQTTLELSVKVAIASGFYHVFKKPIISDDLYDALKYELWDWCGMVEENDVTSNAKINKKEQDIMGLHLDDFMLYVKKQLESDK